MEILFKIVSADYFIKGISRCHFFWDTEEKQPEEL